MTIIIIIFTTTTIKKHLLPTANAYGAIFSMVLYNSTIMALILGRLKSTMRLLKIMRFEFKARPQH